MHTPNGGKGIRIAAPLENTQITIGETTGVSPHNFSGRTTRGADAFSGPAVLGFCSNSGLQAPGALETGDVLCGGAILDASDKNLELVQISGGSVVPNKCTSENCNKTKRIQRYQARELC